jgi:hypothetical protein
MFSFLKEISFPWWVHGAAILGLIAQINGLVGALREWKPRPWLFPSQRHVPKLWPTIILLCLGLAMPVAALAFVEPGRQAFLARYLLPPDPERFHLIPAPGDRYWVLPYMVLWAFPSALFGGLALTFILSARWKVLTDRGDVVAKPGEPPFHAPSTLEVGLVVFSFIICALLPFLTAGWLFFQRTEKSFELSAGLPPWEKGTFILSSLPAATQVLNRGALLAGLGFALAMVMAIMFMRRWQKQGMTWPRIDGQKYKGVPSCSILWILAGAVVWSATPFRSENRSPWPELASLGTARVWPPLSAESVEQNPIASTLRIARYYDSKLEPPGVPLLQGTRDGTRTAASIHFFPDDFIVLGSRVKLSDLREELRVSRNNYPLLHPGEDHHDTIIVFSAPDISGRVLADGLLAVYETGYREVDLASYRLETIRRPMLGLMSRVHLTTTPARLRLPSPDQKPSANETWISCLEISRFEELLADSIRETRLGKNVVLVLSAEQPVHR